MEKVLPTIEPRIYQQVIFSECVTNPTNTLVVLPTGLGKTVIMAYLTAYSLSKEPSKQILIITPTRPLVHQIKQMFADFIGNIDADMILEVSGEIAPLKRQNLYPNAKIIIGTPQTIENDLVYSRLNISNIHLLCIDEAHRSTGDYAYVGIAKQAKCQIIGFTATPGNNSEKILEVCDNLRVEKISVTQPNDYDVNDYISIHTPKVIWIELPEEYRETQTNLLNLQNSLLSTIKDCIPSVKKSKTLGKRDALAIHQQVVSLTKQDSSYGELLIASSNVIRVQHLKELVESQGFPQVLSTIQKWKMKSSSKAMRIFLEDPIIRDLEKTLTKDSLIHPKLKLLINELKKVLKEEHPEDSRIIIFSNFRDTVRFLQSELSKKGIETGVFVGHTTSKADKGLSQKEQVEVVEQFKKGDIKVLISTSVGEEGLDVGNCDLVVFYDSVPSVVRAVQRRGRGRKRKSQIIHLVTKGTKDEGLYWAIQRKDKNMRHFLKVELPTLLNQQKRSREHTTLDGFLGPKTEFRIAGESEHPPSIVIDSREASGRIPRLLKELGAEISTEKLQIGDYILSDRVIVEYKRYSDFIKSIIDGRLFQSTSSSQDSQLVRLKSYNFPILLIQLESDDKPSSLNINSIMGAISSIILDFRISIILTESDLESATFLHQVAKREQNKSSSRPSLPSITKKDQTVEIIQTFMLTSIPGINLTKAHEILKVYKSISELVTASSEDLAAIPSIGPKLASRIYNILNQSGDQSIE
jgi:Fanconi anemia group M protein